MGNTIDDARYDMYIQEKLEDERKEVFGALEKIANSENIGELVKNLEKLKGVYISDKPVGGENLNKAMSEINFDMLKLKKWFEEQLKEYKKSCEKSSRKYLVYGSIITIILGIVFNFLPDLQNYTKNIIH